MPSKSQPSKPQLQMEPFISPPRDTRTLPTSLGCRHAQKPCDVLRDDPELFFSRKYRPNRSKHLCAIVSQTNLYQWLNSWNAPLARWVITEGHLPPILPVGKTTIELTPHPFGTPLPADHFDEQEVKHRLQVFDDDGYASLVVELMVEGLKLELYFLTLFALDPVDNDSLNRAFKVEGYPLQYRTYPSEVRFRITSSGPQRDRKASRNLVEEVVSEAIQWWEVAMAGQPLERRGRPVGSRYLSRTEVENKLVEYLRDRDEGSKKATKDEFVRERLGIAMSTFDEWVKQWGTGWLELREQARRKMSQA